MATATLKQEEHKKIQEAIAILNELEVKLTERIADLHEVKGGMQSRHAYCYYRDHVSKAIKTLKQL